MSRISTTIHSVANAVNKALPDSVKVMENVPFERLTTMGTGGNAAAMIYVSSAEAFALCFQTIGEKGVNQLILGHGSDVIASDSGFDGVVVKMQGGPSAVTEEIPTWVEKLPRLDFTENFHELFTGNSFFFNKKFCQFIHNIAIFTK